MNVTEEDVNQKTGRSVKKKVTTFAQQNARQEVFLQRERERQVGF